MIYSICLYILLDIIIIAAGRTAAQAMARGQAGYQGIYDLCSIYRYIYIII